MEQAKGSTMIFWPHCLSITLLSTDSNEVTAATSLVNVDVAHLMPSYGRTILQFLMWCLPFVDCVAQKTLAF